MRAAFSSALVSIAKENPKVLLLTGDHGYALFDEFRRECPKQYINAGIAEQNMVGMAAGLARTGFRPFVYGLSAFVPVRVIEQIKLDIAHDNLPVVLIGDGAGFVYSHLGTSHQSTEDISCTRAIPNLAIYSPSDKFEMNMCMTSAYKSNSPVYLRMGKSDKGDVHSLKLDSISIGDLLPIIVPENSHLAFIATGSMVQTALNLVKTDFTEASVWSAPFIKPLNKDQIIKICSRSKAIVVIEEHSVIGGLGSAISEITSEHYPIKILRVGVEDRFSHFCGSYEYLLKEHRLNQSSISKKIMDFLDQ
jgi:transketolase